MNFLVGVYLINYFDKMFDADLMLESKELSDIIAKVFNAKSVRITAKDIQFFVPRLNYDAIMELVNIFADLDIELTPWSDNILVSVRLPTNKE